MTTFFIIAWIVFGLAVSWFFKLTTAYIMWATVYRKYGQSTFECPDLNVGGLIQIIVTAPFWPILLGVLFIITLAEASELPLFKKPLISLCFKKKK
jgi:hypothetical protein